MTIDVKKLRGMVKFGGHAAVAASDINALLDRLEAAEQALCDLEVSANTAAFCYERRPENFASALQELKRQAASARELRQTEEPSP